ncbi:MAG: CPBP family intramembrane glutamic endopeptidase [Lactobacillus helveticus]|nr:CPBP family intramembrane glutamic endopeptidase [Lactobacillus helveticus]
MSRFISQAFLQSSFCFAWKPFFDAISTGVSEETFRYLSIVTLLECLKETKHQVTFVVIISAMIFGAFHLLNVMDEPFIAAISQVIMAFVRGLVWAIIYLYTGKLWAMMIIHGMYDYFMFLQPIGISTSNSIFIIYCVIEVIIPILLTIWMLTGKRYKVLQANARRIMLRQNFSF